jgi:hypothetical protein
MEFKQDHRSCFPETIALLTLHASGIFKCLSAIVMPLTIENAPSKHSHHVVPIGHDSGQGLDQVITDIAPAPAQIRSCCTQLGDPILTDELVAAFQGNFRRQNRPPLGDKRPPGLCPHLQCSNHHFPDDCCCCNNQRHPIEHCWHVIGLPTGKQAMLEQFKAQHASGAGAWAPKTVSSATFEPLVAAVLVADQKLVSPPLSQSGLVLNEVEGNLHNVKEMDLMHKHGFKSSSLLHHLDSSPTVSAIPLNSDLVPTLPVDGPDVIFVSRIQRTDTIVAHANTGATVLVSNVQGEIHGAMPATAHCGTAMTGS